MAAAKFENSPAQLWPRIGESLSSEQIQRSALLATLQQIHFGNPALEDRGSMNPRYKTEICRNFKERSKCVYGDKCQFAHGRKELRDVVRNSKYKTKLCQKYWLVGYCAYGPRCNFLHDEMTNEEMDELIMNAASKMDSMEPRASTPTNILDVMNSDENGLGELKDTQKLGETFHQEVFET